MLQKNPSSEGGKVLQNLGQTGPYVMRTDRREYGRRREIPVSLQIVEIMVLPVWT
jgi:hypothetical protein